MSRIQEMSAYVQEKLNYMAHTFVNVFIAVDESADISDTAQILLGE